MELLLTQVLNALVYSMILFLLSAGLSLIFGLMNVINMAHGSFFMLGAYAGFTIAAWTGNFWLAAMIAPLPAAALGALIERLFIRPLHGRSPFDLVLLTFGFTFVFTDLAKLIWGTDIHSLPPPDVLHGSVTILGAAFPVFRLFLISIGLGLALLLWLVLDRSRFGAMVRAGVDDGAMAQGLGINVPLLFTGVFVIGTGLAAFAGVVAGPVIGVYPGMDIDVLIPAFIVIVIGGMGSLRGAFYASLLIGAADTFGKAYLPGAATFLIYVLMIVVLLVRPAGLFGITQGH